MKKTTFYFATSLGNSSLVQRNKVGILSKKGTTLLILAALTLMLTALSAFTVRPVIEEKVIVFLQRPLEEKLVSNYFAHATDQASIAAAFTEVYNTNNYEPLWVEAGKPSAQLDNLVETLKAADQEGLTPANYHLKQLEALKSEAGIFSDAARVAEFDQLATAAYLLYASHLYNGSLGTNQLGANWHIQPKSLPLAQYLNQALQNKDIQPSLVKLATVNPAFALLKKELANLKVIAAKGGWPVLTQSPTGQPVQSLQNRLILSGDLDSTSANKHPEQALTQAIQKFQKRHGMLVTGKVDERTFAALNIPVEKRIQQVVLNLERMRMQPRRAGETVIKVNIPDYKLQVWEENKPVMEANVVIGKTEFATPIFEDSLESIVFSPEWNVPNQIATEEILPNLQKNPGYLQKNNFEVYDSYSANAKPINPYAVNWNSVSPEKFKYRFVQKANKKNALGAVKFLFPNAHNIYIHDTPAKHLFKENKRAYSHGCVRLENPGKLAARLLKKDTDWTETKIQERMGLTESTKVALKKAVKVEIMYLTAFVQDGHLQFRDDVYGYDQAQLQTLRSQANF